MHYYPFHMGDYLKDAAHLSLLEEGIYRRLLDKYYETEKPLDKEIKKLARSIRASDYINELQMVLSEFFILEDDGWHNNRCDKEIKKYQGFAESGKKGAEKRWHNDSHPIAPLKPPYSPPIDSLMAEAIAPPMATKNQEPRTNNQEPSVVTHPAIISDKPLAKARATRLQTDFKLPKDWGLWAVEQGLSREEVLFEADKFKDHWLAKAGKDGTKLDWLATWRNWIRNRRPAYQKTFAEKTKEFKEKEAAEFYKPGLGSASEETLRKLGLAK